MYIVYIVFFTILTISFITGSLILLRNNHHSKRLLLKSGKIVDGEIL